MDNHAIARLFPQDRIINGALCYVIRDGQVLMLRRNRPPHVGRWTAPGGKLELGESPDEGVIREMLEETGLTVIKPVLRGIVTVYDIAYPIHWLLFIYRADHTAGQVAAADTHEGELRWIPLDRVMQMEMPRADVHYLPRVLAKAELFRAKFIYNTPDECLQEIFYE